MQWLARAVPMGPDGSIGFGVAEHGPVPGPPVSARVFGAHSLPIGDNGKLSPLRELARCWYVPVPSGAYRLERPTEMTTETYQYRGYDIVPMWQWLSWCTGIYARRPDLPIVSRSTLLTMTPQKEEAVAEAKHRIDQLLARVK
jgi:hypothetical protein